MKKILVPTDFSPASRNACKYAALLAQAFGAEIHLLHVYKDLIPATVGPEPWSHKLSEVLTRSETLINKEVKFLEAEYSIPVNGEARKGFKGITINRIAREMEADLIVLGMKSHHENKMAGNTVFKTVLNTNIPVLVIPENAGYAAIRNIVLAVDFSKITDSSRFDPLFKIVRSFDASLRVLHIEKKGGGIIEAELPGKLQLGRVLSKVTYWYDKVEYDDVEGGIQHFIQNHPTDMLVMVAYHHSIFEQIIGSAHTLSISFDIKLPLLILKNK